MTALFDLTEVRCIEAQGPGGLDLSTVAAFLCCEVRHGGHRGSTQALRLPQRFRWARRIEPALKTLVEMLLSSNRHVLDYHVTFSAGVHYVFDTSVAAGFSILECQKEFVQRYRRKHHDSHALPMFTSSCPGKTDLLPTGITISLILDLVASLFCFPLFPLLLLNLINVCTVQFCAVRWKEARAAIGPLQRKDRRCSFHHSLYWRWIARVKDLFSLLLSLSLLISLTPSLSTDVVNLLPVASRSFTHVERTNMNEMFKIWVILFCWEIKKSCFSAPFFFLVWLTTSEKGCTCLLKVFLVRSISVLDCVVWVVFTCARMRSRVDPLFGACSGQFGHASHLHSQVSTADHGLSGQGFLL